MTITFLMLDGDRVEETSAASSLNAVGKKRDVVGSSPKGLETGPRALGSCSFTGQNDGGTGRTTFPASRKVPAISPGFRFPPGHGGFSRSSSIGSTRKTRLESWTRRARWLPSRGRARLAK